MELIGAVIIGAMMFLAGAFYGDSLARYDMRKHSRDRLRRTTPGPGPRDR